MPVASPDRADRARHASEPALPTETRRAAKAWWSGVLGVEPYFDEPFYVGYNVGGYELGLLPSANPVDGALVYWGVADVTASVAAAKLPEQPSTLR